MDIVESLVKEVVSIKITFLYRDEKERERERFVYSAFSKFMDSRILGGYAHMHVVKTT